MPHNLSADPEGMTLQGDLILKFTELPYFQYDINFRLASYVVYVHHHTTNYVYKHLFSSLGTEKTYFSSLGTKTSVYTHS